MKGQRIFDSTILKCNRFARFGEQTSWWTVKGNKADAVSFSVSKKVLCLGFLTFGCKQITNPCSIQATIQYGSEILGEIKTTLHDKKFENNVTEIFLSKPVKLLPNQQYDIVYNLDSQSLCNYGDQGKTKFRCEDIVFSFKKSEISKNGTNAGNGQIPGILFRNAFT